MPDTPAIRRLRDARTEKALTARLRRLPEERAFATVRRLIALEPKVGLRIANKRLRDRRLLEQLLREGLAAGNASTVRFWLDSLGKRMSATRLVQIVREHAADDPASAERAIYWLPSIIPKGEHARTGLDDLRADLVHK